MMSSLNVAIPATSRIPVLTLPVPAAPTTVAIPAPNVTVRLSAKLTVAAVPTADPLS